MSGVMHGNFKTNPNNKNLDRPRAERKNFSRSTCVSVGVEHGGSGESKMQFSGKHFTELWGKKR